MRTQVEAPQSSPEIGLLDAAIPYLLASLQDDLSVPVCLIVADPEQAVAARDELSRWAPPGVEVWGLPEPDFPYADLDGPSSPAMTARAQLASYLALRRDEQPRVVLVASVLAIIGALRPPEDISDTAVKLQRGSRIRPTELLSQLDHMGYERVEFVTRVGEMTSRGGIVDVFSPIHEEPFRIEYFGDEIDSIRFFDPSTQRATETTDEALATANSAEGDSTSILDYLPERTVVALHDPLSLNVRSLRLHGELAEYGASTPPADGKGWSTGSYLSWSEVEAKLKGMRQLRLAPWKSSEDERRRSLFSPAGSYVQHIDKLLAAISEALARDERVVLVSLQAQRLQELLEEAGLHVPTVNDVSEVPPPGSVSLVQGSASKGWVLRDTVRFISDLEIFGFVKQERRTSRARPRPTTYSLSINPGDLVAHVDHGIGRFVGLTTLSTGETEHEYLEITYLDGDTLYVPTDQIHRVTRYIGGGDHAPRLSRLGSTEWETAKQRARQSTRMLARELIELYAQRQLVEGHSFSPDTVWQQEMEASFPYVETADQAEAIEAVKHDMQRPRPMDRLICGDVGYGKTEIALRAAFKAVMDGTQVAVLAPTTVLAQQHYVTFAERLAPFPVRVEVLSRFTPREVEAETLKGVASGTVDICIGTHRLLQKDVTFRNLGLLVVDEEQRFGVLQKESLRSIRSGLDTLTLSATPIPRTLHMSLTGIRDLSTMETPPEERLAVRTHVGPYDSALVRQAILRELERNGQAFFVHNRVQTIDTVAKELQALVPEARFGVAHGRMPEHALERTMKAFASREIDVLVATTIIQLGLDMPNANTLIVNQAERLGLTQLYQLRGRVGRGRNQAYAYFFFPRHRELTPQAHKRLRTIFEANELGAGLEVALRDLEIRGTGSLLGTRQSGHIAAVGFELYCQILAEEVRRLQSDLPTTTTALQSHRQHTPALDLPVSAYIPDTYVTSQGARISLYKKLGEATTVEQLESIESELKDRFGPLPHPVQELLYVARVRTLAVADGVTSITRMGSDIVLVPERMDALPVSLNLGPAIRVGNEQVRINTARTGGKWRSLLLTLLQNTNEGRSGAPR